MTECEGISGACLCGGVRYQISEPLSDAGNCHCSMCRRFSGAAFSSSARVKPEAFRWLSGERLIARYPSSPDVCRLFCRVCGSSLGVMEDEQVRFIFLGTVSGDPGVRPAEHIFVAAKAPWYQITDDLSQYQGWPDTD